MKFSIITPVYNREDCIERCLLSVIKQLKWNIEFEHIVVDDGSSDNTKSIIEDYAKRYPHIRFIPFEKNKGTNAARNAAIARASGEYCIILDSDDYFVDEALNIINNTIQHNQQYKHFLFAPDDKIEYYKTIEELQKDPSILTFLDFLSGKVNGDFIHAISTKNMQKNPFDENIRIYEGVFFLRLYKEAEKIFFNKKIVTIRDRGRKDCVTKETLRTNVSIILREIIAKKRLINWFENDFKRNGLNNILGSHYLRLLEDQCLITDYKSAKDTKNNLCQLNINIPLTLKLILKYRLGFLYRFALTLYLKVKYTFKRME